MTYVLSSFYCASSATVLSSKFYQSIQSENDLILNAPTCVLVPVIPIYLGPFEMPAVQDRPVPFITHPQSWLKLLCFHLARRSFWGRINDHIGGAFRFFIASGWLSDIAIPQRSARSSHMRLLTSLSGIRRVIKMFPRLLPADTCLCICISHRWLGGHVLANCSWTPLTKTRRSKEIPQESDALIIIFPSF